MNETVLIIDGDFVCHRSLYATGQLRSGSVSTGVIFGYLRQLKVWEDKFQPTYVVHCFNGPTNNRYGIYGDYNAKRKADKAKALATMDADDRKTEELKWKDFDTQRTQLRTTLLRDLGYNNVLSVVGYESDDLIASAALAAERDNLSAVIVTSDNDMLQCIRPNIVFYNPQKDVVVNRKSFVDEHGIEPSLFWRVKVLAGCSSDDVPGVRGVGEKTAFKYLRGEKVSDKVKESIKQFMASPEALRNKRLVKLPLKGTPEVTFKPDSTSPQKERAVAKVLGFRKI